MANGQPSDSLTLALELASASFDFTISNRGARPVRVWDIDNSWGAESFSIEITSAVRPNWMATLRRRPQVWSANLPQYVEIPPGGTHRVTLRAADMEWSDAETLENDDEPLYLRGVLTGHPSPEAVEEKVFIGCLVSPPVESQPPHEWVI